MWKPGGSRSWNSNVNHVYAIEGFDENNNSIYWHSDYGFVKEDFSDTGYNLMKKIFALVVDVD